MAALMDPEEVKYDVIAGLSPSYARLIGVSVGSLNGLLIAMYAPGTEKAASQGLSGLWANITQGDIFEHWPYVGPLKGLFAQGSFLDNSPLLATINKKFHEMGGVIHRKFTVGIVDAETAEYIVKDERGGHENMPQNIFASASVPGIFPSIITSDHMLVDGGVMDNINLRAAIKRCSEIVGDDDSAITVDVIMTNPGTISALCLSCV